MFAIGALFLFLHNHSVLSTNTFWEDKLNGRIGHAIIILSAHRLNGNNCTQRCQLLCASSNPLGTLGTLRNSYGKTTHQFAFAVLDTKLSTNCCTGPM